MPTPPPAMSSDLLQGEVQAIIGREPSWLIRWGTVVVCFTVAVLLGIGYLVKYPDLVVGRVTITTGKPPIGVPARASGKIERLFVADGETVAAGAPLALLENDAAYADITALADNLEAAADFPVAPEQFVGYDWPRTGRLGDLGADYSAFLVAFLEWRNTMDEDLFSSRIASLEKQRAGYAALNTQLRERASLLDRDLELKARHFEAQKRLWDQKLVAETAVEAAESDLLAGRLQRTGLEEEVVRNTIESEELHKLLLELKLERRERTRQSLQAAQEAFKLLREAYRVWERRYLPRAPVAGQVSFYRFWSDDQYVSAGDEIMTLLPTGDHLVARLVVPPTGVGRVETGQEVRLKLDSYPYAEFGIVRGRVAGFAPIHRDDSYLLDVALPEGLRTSYGKTVAFRHNMGGTGEVVTRDMRLIERFFNQIRRLVNRGG